MHNLWRDVALQLIRSNTKRAKHIAHYTLTSPEDKKAVFDAIARDMLLGITKPDKDMAHAMHEQMLSVIPLLAPNNPEKALEYLRQQNPVFVPQYMPHIVAGLAPTNPKRAHELYEEVIKLADTPVHKDNRAMIIGNITAARFGIPPFGEGETVG
jgi:tryptophan synthase alpha subunit